MSLELPLTPHDAAQPTRSVERGATRSTTERVTKYVVLASVCLALVYETLSAGRDLSWLPWVTLAAAAAGVLAGKMFPERAVGGIVAFGYVVPVIFLAVHGHFRGGYLTPWVGGVLGAMLVSDARGQWSVPERLRLALVAWALAVAVTWPIIALRELDWMPSLWSVPPSAPSSAVHSVPATIWIARMAQVHLLGLLWIDWLCRHFPPGRVDGFERDVMRPLGMAAGGAALVALYQGFVDLRFLSIGIWSQIGRASGTLADGNASGMLSALWVAAPLLLACSSPSRAGRIGWRAVALCSFLAVWATGSRTALLCAVVATVGVAWSLATAQSTESRRRSKRLLAIGVVTAGLLVVALVERAPAMGPVERVRVLLPDFSLASIRSAAWELWARNGYGLMAVEMIRTNPWEGVGVGAFHGMTGSYPELAPGGVPPDNAQNWFRHQLAELGILGSLGWIGWAVLFAARLFAPPRQAERAMTASVAKFTLVGFALGSMVGMPGQNVLVAMTFWTFAVWLLLVVSPGERWAPSASRHGSLRSWLAVAAAVLVFAGWTARSSMRDLRPPFRAKQADTVYRYGFYDSFDAAAGETRTSRHAVWVPQAPRRWLKLTMWVEHPDADSEPVLVRVWRDHERIVRRRFPRNVTLTKYIPVPGDNRRFVLETDVDRTYVRPDQPYADVGLSLAWEYVDAPGPQGS